MKIAKVVGGAVVEVKEIQKAFLDSLTAANNPKFAGWLPVVEDVKPVLGQHEFLVWSYVVESKQVRVVWTKQTDQASIDLSTKRIEIDDALAQLTLLRDSPGDLNLKQLSNGARLVAKVLVWLINRGREIFER